MTTAGQSRYPKLNFKTARDWQVYHAYNDPEFIKAAESLYTTSGGNIHANSTDAEGLAAKHHIRTGDIGFYWLTALLPGIRNETANGNIAFDPSSEMFTVTFNYSMKYPEYLEHWHTFSILRESLSGPLPKTRRQPPYNTALIYAISKLRPQTTFKEIYKKYDLGMLPGYSGSKSIKSEELLERFYEKYDPDK